MPSSKSEKENENPIHQSREGARSIGRHTSSVTVAGFLPPVMSGIRSGEQTSAILLLPLSDNLQIVHRRAHAQLFENPILPLVVRQPRDPTGRIVQIPEDDRASGAGLLTRRANVAVCNRHPLTLCLDLGLLNALHA